VDRVSYSIHKKPGSPDSLRVDYWHGLRVVAREWVCVEHHGFAGEKARGWWWKRTQAACPGTVAEALEWIDQEGTSNILEPHAITVNESGQWPEIIKFQFEENHDQNRIAGSDQQLPARIALAGRDQARLLTL
jgi:DNA repair protein RadD